MKELKYSEILSANREIEESLSGNRYEMAVLSNIVTSQIKDILEYALRVHGINAHVKFGDYDNIVQESEKFRDTNLVIIFWELANIIDGLQYKANLMDDNEINNLISKVKAEIDFVISNLKKTSMVLINKFSSLIFNYQNLRRNNFDIVCSELNDYLQKKISSNIILIDIDKILAKVSIDRSVDLRYYYSSKALYTIEFYKEYSNYIKPVILSATGKSKKALIFDCDNTLWRGILEEDGFDGIKISSNTNNGVVFEEVQSVALELNKKGVLIGLCSKNNSQDVDEIINNHPDMKLRDENITIKKVNWNDKAENLKSIATELNIGLDSLVFIDDSDFEINYIRESLPEVTVLQVPSKSHEYPRMIRENIMLFYNISESREDIKKMQMYKEQRQRETLKNSFKNLEDYLKSLDLKLTIFINEKSLISRMAQLTQKTNQFNLTTKRYTETDMEKFVESAEYRVFAFESKDKFGSYGVTGLVILKLYLKEKIAEVDTFLMSCRVIGRNFEFALFNFLVNYVNNLDIQSINGRYIKTLKNEQVRDMYENFGFDLISRSDNEKKYSLNPANYKPKYLDYIGIIIYGSSN